MFPMNTFIPHPFISIGKVFTELLVLFICSWLNFGTSLWASCNMWKTCFIKFRWFTFFVKVFLPNRGLPVLSHGFCMSRGCYCVGVKKIRWKPVLEITSTRPTCPLIVALAGPPWSVLPRIKPSKVFVRKPSKASLVLPPRGISSGTCQKPNTTAETQLLGENAKTRFTREAASETTKKSNRH